MTALAKYKRGETLNGQPFVLFNTWTRRFDFLYIQKGIEQSHESRWSVTHHEASDGDDDDDDDDPAGGSDAGTPTPKKKQKIGDDKYVGVAGGSVKGKAGKGKAGKDTEKVKAMTAEEFARDQEKQKAKAESARVRKELDGKLSKVKTLKVRCDAAQSSYSEVVRACANQPEWSWCNEMHRGEPQAALKMMDEFKRGSQFWSSWSVQAGFAAYAKKWFSKDVLDTALARTEELEKMVASLEKSTSKLTKMHAASLEK
jgi:hypothetical protein